MAPLLRLALGLTALLLLFSAGSALALHAGGRQVHLSTANNQTQVMLNFTLHIKTCRGEDIIWQHYDYPLIFINGIDINYTKKLNCARFSCKIEYPQAGNYSLDIEWLGRRVFSQILYLNGSQLAVTVKANISNIMVSVYTLDGRELQGLKVMLRVGDRELEVLSGQRLALPHGHVGYEVSSPSGLAKTSGVSEVNCGTAVLRANLSVFSRLVFAFRLLDNLPAAGLNASVKIFYEEMELKNVDLRSSSEAEIPEAPTGRYKVLVFIVGRLFEERIVEVTAGSNAYVIPLSVLSSAAIRLLDASGNAIQDENLEVVVADPLGRVYRSDLSGGLLTLPYAPLGSYELTIYDAKWGVQLGSYAFSISSTDTSRGIDVLTNLVKSIIRVKASGSQTLPRDSYILLKYSGIVVFAERLSEEKTSVTIELSYLPLEAVLQLTYRYGTYAQEEVLRVTSGENLVEVQLYDVKLTVIDLDKKPVGGCDISISSKYFNYSFKLDYNEILLKNLPLTDAKVSVKCSGIEVLRATLTPEELRRKNVTLVAHVGDIAVYVKGWFGRPISGALVKIAVAAAEYLAYTDQSGFASVKNVPLPPTANITLTVSYRGVVYERGLDVNIKNYDVFLDIFFDTPIFVLSLSQTIIVVAVSLMLTVTALLAYTRIARLKEIKELFVEPLGVAEEREGEGVLARFRRFFSRRRRRKAEEEELFFSF